METIQVQTKKGGFITADVLFYSGNFAVLQNKKIENDNVITTQQFIPLDEIANVSLIRKAEIRPVPPDEPQLLVEGAGDIVSD